MRTLGPIVLSETLSEEMVVKFVFKRGGGGHSTNVYRKGSQLACIFSSRPFTYICIL